MADYRKLSDEALQAALIANTRDIDCNRYEIAKAETFSAHLLARIHEIKRVQAERAGHFAKVPG